MRIGILCYPSIGGSGLVATELGISLARRGHEVHFISYATPFKLPQFERNIHFHSVDPINYPLFNQTLYTFSLTAKIVEVVNEHKLEIVHAHYSIPHSLCAHLAREITGADFRIVTTLHGTDVTLVGQDKPLFPINKYGIEKSDLVTTVSNFQREHTLRNFGIANDIQVIYNFIDPDVFKPCEQIRGRRDCLSKPGQKVVMHISNFRQPKNPIGACRAFAIAAKQVDAKLVLIGDGPEITELKQICKELGICERIQHLGKMDNVETILPAADVVLQPSYLESFGMVLLEAMSCGVVPVASDIDGIPEVVLHGETGLLAHPDDHEALAAHLVTLLTDDPLRARMAAAGRDRAIHTFHRDLIIPQYEAAYETLLALSPVG